jgi:alpha-L-fucosidase
MDENAGNTRWLKEARFGLFIHWGLYALPARGEWVKHYERISDADYDNYFRFFDPDLYDAFLASASRSPTGTPTRPASTGSA